MPAPLVAICMPIGGNPDAETMQCLIDLKTAIDSTNAHGVRTGQGELLRYCILTVGGQPIPKARNGLTQEALKAGADYILWIDADMTFNPAIIPRLLSRKLPIVGGLCFGRHPPSYMPTLLRLHAKNRNLDGAPYGFLYDFPPNDLVEVDATGAAFLLVQRKVFEQIHVTADEQWWTEMHVPGVGSEDLSFCARARQAGFRIFVDTGARVGHKATVKIDAEMAERLRGNVRVNEWIPEGMPVNAGAEAGPPVASIVIPTYNTPSRFLHAAVHSALEQTLPVEVIVVDDGSRDVDVVPGVNEGLVKLVRHPTNKGVAEALNSGFREATTDWICWLSADDLIAPTKIQRQLQAALVTGSKAVCHGYSVLDDANGAWQMPRPAPWYSIEDQQAALVRGCCVNGSTTMIHRSVFNEVGLYDSSYRYSQDWEMWLRIGSRYLWHYLPDNLGTRRESLGNLTARIRGDDEKSKVRNAEDAKIRAKYAPTLATAIDALR